MAKPYDATTKNLVEARPEDWLEFVGLSTPAGQKATVIDADLATVTTDADRVIRIGEPPQRLAHLEFESGKDTSHLPERLLRYNVLLDYRYGLPVESTAILLRRESDSPRLTGRIERTREDGSVYLTFTYNVVRLWEIDVSELLASGIGTLPLAPIAAIPVELLPNVVQRMQERIKSEAQTDEEAATLWAATYILMGLKYPPEFTDQLLKGIKQMEESSTYQALLARGRVEGRVEGQLEEVRKMVLRLGGRKFGAAAANTRETLEAITSLERLEAIHLRLFDAKSWDELLAQ